MAIIGSSKGYSKKDINFFEEYTAAAKRTARYLVYFIFAALAVIAVFVIWWLIGFLQNNAIKKDINALQARIDSEEFKDVELLATQYQNDLAKRNEQLYAMSSMRHQIDTTLAADTELLDLLMENIPSTTYISSYSLDGNTFTIEGYSFDYYDAANLVAMFQADENTFNPDNPTALAGNRVNGISVLNPDGTIDRIDCYYTFTIQGHLTNNVVVAVSSYANVDGGVVALGAMQSYTFKYNDPSDPYVANDIANITYNGVSYNLTSVVVNGAAMSGEEFAQVLATGTHTISQLQNNTNITYYYSVAVATEGGEA